MPAFDQLDTLHGRNKPGRIDGEDGRGEILRVCLESVLPVKDVDGIGIRSLGCEQDAR